MLDKLHASGERLTQALIAHKNARDKRLPPQDRIRTRTVAERALIEWSELTDPSKLMPYLVSLARDAARYQHIRNELTPEERDTLRSMTSLTLDNALDELREEWFAAKNTPELPLTEPLVTHDGTTIAPDKDYFGDSFA